MNSKPTNSSPRKRRRYDDAFRAEALRLAGESRSTQAAARQLGISPKLLYKGQKAPQPVREAGSGEGESAAMRQLRAEVRRWQQEGDILKKPWPSSYHRRCEPLPLCPSAKAVLCRASTLSGTWGGGSYYRWRQKVAARSSVPAWERELCRVFFQHKRRYGTRRLRAELQAQGHRVGRHRVRHALRQRELVAVQPRAFVPRTTQSEHGGARGG